MRTNRRTSSMSHFFRPYEWNELAPSRIAPPPPAQGRPSPFPHLLHFRVKRQFVLFPLLFRSFFGENRLFVSRETVAPSPDSVSTQTSPSRIARSL